MLASKRFAGRRLTFEDKEYVVEELTAESFDGVDIALFSADGSISKEFVPIAVDRRTIVVDNSFAFRMDVALNMASLAIGATVLEFRRSLACPLLWIVGHLLIGVTNSLCIILEFRRRMRRSTLYDDDVAVKHFLESALSSALRGTRKEVKEYLTNGTMWNRVAANFLHIMKAVASQSISSRV